MIHKFLPLVILFACFSCGSKTESQQQGQAFVEESEIIPAGLKLIESNDCQTCHHTINTLVGPSYTAIANKYENTSETEKQLAAKIIAGGTGVWGDMPMNPHPTLKEEEAIEMVKYILTLKK